MVDLVLFLTGFLQAFSASLLAVIPLYVKWIRDTTLRPIIKISYGNTEPYSREAMEAGESLGGAKLAYFMRLRVENSGKSLAKNCEGRLNKVYNPERPEEVFAPFDPIVLKWVGHDKGPININSEEYEFLFLFKVYIDDQDHVHFGAEDLRPRGILFVAPMQDWVFEISIYGENAKSVSKSYRFTAADQYNEVTIEEYTGD